MLGERTAWRCKKFAEGGTNPRVEGLDVSASVLLGEVPPNNFWTCVPVVVSVNFWN